MQSAVWIRQLLPSSDLGIGVSGLWIGHLSLKGPQSKGGEKRAKGTHSAFFCCPASAPWHFCSVSRAGHTCLLSSKKVENFGTTCTYVVSTLNAGPQLSEPYFVLGRTKISVNSQGSWGKRSKVGRSSCPFGFFDPVLFKLLHSYVAWLL